MQRDYRNVYFPILSNNCYAFLRAFLKVYDENDNDLKYKLCRQLFSRIREIELSIDAVWRLHILTDKQYYKIRKKTTVLSEFYGRIFRSFFARAFRR